MYSLALVSVAVAVVSFAFAVYAHFKTESKKVAEAANIAAQKERLKSALCTLEVIFHSTDAIVQIAKMPETTVAQLQNLARLTRGQVIGLAEQLEIQRTGLEKWRFGELVPSEEMKSINLDLEKPALKTRDEDGQ